MPSKLRRYLLAESKHSQSHLWLLGVLSFLESTILPIPLETVLIPYYQIHRQRIWRVALVVTLGCLVGASIFYLAGSFLMDRYGDQIIATFSSPKDFQNFKVAMEEHGFLFILATGLTPIPFQIGMLVSGAAGYPFGAFILAAFLARGIRYFGLGWLVKHYGDDAARVWKENKLKAGLIALAAIGVFFLVGQLLKSLLLGS